MAGKNNKKGRGAGGSTGPGRARVKAGFAPANTIPADSGTRYLRSAIRRSPREATNERMVAATGRMTPLMAKFNGRRNTTGDFYRPGTGNKYQGEAARSGNRVKVSEQYSRPNGTGGIDRGYTGRSYSYRIADQAGPRPVGARTTRRRLKG
jgi:hypothetical protein